MNNFKDLCNIKLIIKYKLRKIFKKCIFKNCNILPNYNYINEKALYCVKHKEDTMINVIDKKCIIKNCNKIPIFNYENEKALYCVKHKLDNMIDVKNKKCKIKDCKKQPAYNYENEKALYCAQHKLDGMVNVLNKKCIKLDCKKQPTYNYENEKALYCAQHKLDGMINVKDKKCRFKDCKKQPTYNYENEKALYCTQHKLDGMTNVKDKKCRFKDCKKQPHYNYINEKALYCAQHKLDGMINVKDKKCKTNLCNTLVKNKYKGYCLRCFIYNFPDSKLIRDYGTREAKVSQFIKDTYTNLNITYNKAIDGGCSSHRPDIFICCLTHSVIIEVDEHQHKKGNSYNPECELRRINNLFTDLADRPIIFIRFNPDSYTNNKNKLIKSCFEYSEDRGLPKANKTLQTRLKKLKNIIDDNLVKVPTEHITTIKLYYDGY